MGNFISFTINRLSVLFVFLHFDVQTGPFSWNEKSIVIAAHKTKAITRHSGETEHRRTGFVRCLCHSQRLSLWHSLIPIPTLVKMETKCPNTFAIVFGVWQSPNDFYRFHVSITMALVHLHRCRFIFASIDTTHNDIELPLVPFDIHISRVFDAS